MKILNLSMNVFAPKSCRVVSFLLANSNKMIMQKEIVKETGLSKGMVSRVMRELIRQGFVSRPYRARFVLDNPSKLLLTWAAHRNIRSNPAYFAPDASALKGVKNTHTLFSGAWLDDKYLKTRFTTVYVPPNFKAKLKSGVVSDLLDDVVLILAPDEHVFYNQRRIKGKKVVNPYQLFVDLMSFGGIAETAANRIAEKYGLRIK